MYSAEERKAEDTSAPDVLESDVAGTDAGVARQPSSSGASQLPAADIAAGMDLCAFSSIPQRPNSITPVSS